MNGELPEVVDVLVVGGGIHGVGVAQAAAASGRSVLLVEERQLAAGTSSKSSKLIHGGLRYLESRQWSLVRESLAERAILLSIAPHLVVRRDFLLPIYSDALRGRWTMRAGLALYALLAGFQPHTGFGRVPRRRWERLDGLATAGLVEVLRYCDACTDDAALGRAVAASARELGAQVREGVALLEARRVCGSRSGFVVFRRNQELAMNPRSFLRAKQLEMRQRHQKFEDTPYTLEPNCKESPGGLRDLQVIVWVARAAGLGRTWREMAANGLVTPFSTLTKLFAKARRRQKVIKMASHKR